MHKVTGSASSLRRKVSFDLENLTDDSDIEDYRDRNIPDWTFRSSISSLPPRKRRNYAVITILILLPPAAPKGLSPYLNYDAIDWSRYAYTQYVTDEQFLCNSVMVFEALHRLGSRADRILFYPNHWDTYVSGINDRVSQLLVLARDKYKVQLEPIAIDRLHESLEDQSTWDSSITKLWAFRETTYRRILQIDSDVLILQNLDELFFLPSAPVAMPRAYWDYSNNHQLTSLMLLVEPSYIEYKSMMDKVQAVEAGQLSKDQNEGHALYDMELLNDRFGNSALILPHRQYGLVTGEFRTKDHRNFLGNDYETWNPDKVLSEAKLVHFSDWPLPKPWIMWPQKLLAEILPKCDNNPGTPQESGCRDREVWKQLYETFRLTRRDVCQLLSFPAPEWPPKPRDGSNKPTKQNKSKGKPVEKDDKDVTDTIDATLSD
ncbi:alphaN-acetylglucosamine transferase [Talaromyces proteolyticus]|uniref:AlphaN-acetylglucosamine transferase n=1 Tax=Talaromyces proteolyticus TaxID=1131652 RepID=A0AAD4KL56_9EURO|nr:alphaN-acetylglucosamine transferase [Talaromyces proteolyticus]KAH8695268.1 alphaN-acetylglucosamine transferase [Talaromyces proteolyticus]